MWPCGGFAVDASVRFNSCITSDLRDRANLWDSAITGRKLLWWPSHSFIDLFPSRATSVAVFLALIGISTDAARADCALSEKNIALARVVSKEGKLYFISGPRKGAPECPSAASACTQKAYVVPGDEILTNATDDLYACARYKSRSYVETVGYLPRAALEIVPSEQPSIEKWKGTWRRDLRGRDSPKIRQRRSDRLWQWNEGGSGCGASREAQ